MELNTVYLRSKSTRTATNARQPVLTISFAQTKLSKRIYFIEATQRYNGLDITFFTLTNSAALKARFQVFRNLGRNANATREALLFLEADPELLSVMNSEE